MDYVASNASVHTHAPFPLVGDYAPNPTEHRTHSVALRVLRILLKGMLKRRPLCRDVTNRYTLMRWQYTIPSGDISFAKRGFPKWKPLGSGILNRCSKEKISRFLLTRLSNCVRL